MRPDIATSPDADFFATENDFLVYESWIQAGALDRIVGACDYLIPAQPPNEGLAVWRELANVTVRGDHVHTAPSDSTHRVHWPGRRLAIGRCDLAGSVRDALIPAAPQGPVLSARQEQSVRNLRGNDVHTFANHAGDRGHHPGRKAARRSPRRSLERQ